MMIHNIYSVYDNKAKAFLPPFILATDGMAIRAIGNCVNDEKHQFGRNPNDYQLFRIGMFNDNDATIEPSKPFSLGLAAQFIEDKTPDSQLRLEAIK